MIAISVREIRSEKIILCVNKSNWKFAMKAEEEATAKMLQCNHCPKEFRYNSERKRHELSHFPHFECETCSKKFSFM